jgi:hypothetical protein
MSHSDRFFRLLGILLLGYAILGKGWAYLGIGPLFVGEILLAYGIFALATCGNWSRIFRTAWVWPLLVFMVCCALQTLPYLRTYGAEALRDAAVWIWGAYALVIASLLAAEPQRLLTLEIQFRKFAKIFLVLAPFSYIVSTFFADFMPKAPWAATAPLILVKGGDVVVHLTGIFAYAVLVGGGLAPLFIILTTMINLCLTFTGRAAMVTFGLGAIIVTSLRPRSRIILGIFPTLLAGFLLMLILDVHIQGRPGEVGREISADQIIQNIQSIFTKSDNENLSGSKQWRLLWWDSVIHYTFHGKYFWTGKGFGVNLADDDGFQVKEDGSLRSPHNGHITILARAGVPGLMLWIVCQLTLAGTMLVSAYMAHRQGRRRWSSLFVVLLVYWAAFMTNAAFDVYLESPMGGIWMWCVYGTGIGAAWIFRHHPQVLAEEFEVEMSVKRLKPKPRKRKSIIKSNRPAPAVEGPALERAGVSNRLDADENR